MAKCEEDKAKGSEDGLPASKQSNQEKPANNKYEAIVRAMREAIILISDGVIIEWNQGAENLFGYSKEEVEGKNIHDLIATEASRSRAKSGMAIFQSTGDSPVLEKSQELEAFHKDGHPIPIELSLSQIRIGDKDSVIGVARDISERKKMERRLKESEAKHRELIEHSRDPIFAFSPDEKYQFVNSAFSEPHGKKPNEIIGNTPHDIFPATEAEKRLTLVREVFKTGERGEIEVKVIGNSGETRFFLTSVDPVKDDDGKVKYVMCISKDITERKQAEEKLRVSEEKYRSLTEGIKDIAYTMNGEGTLDFIGTQVLGYGLDPNEMLGRTFLEFVHPADRAELQAQFLRSATQGEEINSTFRVIDKRGGIHWFEEAGKMHFDVNGKCSGSAGVLRDITARRKAEDALKINETELTSVNTQLNEAQHIAHIGSWTHNIEAALPEWSAEMFNIFGLDPQKGTPSYTEFRAHIHPDHQQLVDEAVKAQITEGKDYSLELKIIRPDGKESMIHMQSKNVSGNGQPARFIGTAQDITASKKAEIALGKSEERFRNVIEATGDYIFEINASGIITFISNRVRDILGYEPKELIGKTPFDLIGSTEEVARMSQIFGEYSTKKSQMKGEEHTCLSKDGRELTVSVTAQPIFNEAGELSGYQGAVEDITKRKKTEEALINEKKFSDAIIESIPGMLYVYDEQGNHIRHNSQHEKITGYSAEELTQLNPLSWYDNEGDVEKVNTAIAQVFETGYGEIEVPMKIKDGTKIMMHFTGARLIMNGQKYFVGVGTDITKRKQVEAESREAKELTDAIVENVPLMVFLKEARDLRFVVFNKAGEELLGHQRETLIGKSDLDLFPAEQAAHFIANDRQVLNREKGALDIPEEFVDTADKGRRVIHTKKVCIPGNDGKPKYLLGISEDITEKKKQEAEKRQSEKMETVGQLAGGVAHDLNNIISIVTNYTAFALEGVDPNSSVAADLNEVITASNRAAKLTKDLLAFSRKTPLQKKSENINSIVKDFLSSMGRLVGEDIELNQHLSNGLWEVQVDKEQIANIVGNLVINARHAMPKGGALLVETKNVQFDKDFPSCEGARSGNFVELSVEDTGTGISAENLKQIFDPFFTTKEVGVGTGMGLARVYGLVRQHGGFITVETEPGKGTKFKLYFPSTGVINQATAPTEVRESLPRGTETIIVVDDEPSLVNVSSRILRGCGYKVLPAENAGEVYLQLEENEKEGNTVHLVLTDIRMPKTSGIMLRDSINKRFPKIQVVLMSGDPKENIDKIGDTEFISKPFNPMSLSTLIRKVLDQKK